MFINKVFNFFNFKTNKLNKIYLMININYYTYYQDIFSFLNWIRDCEEIYRKK